MANEKFWHAQCIYQSRMWYEKIKNVYKQILRWDVIAFSHGQTKKRFVHVFDSRAATVGSSCTNDIVLLSPKVKSFEGTIVRSNKNLYFVELNKRKKKLHYRPIEVAGYKIQAIPYYQILLLVMGFVSFVVFSFSTKGKVPKVQQQEYVLPARNVYGNLMDKKSQVSTLAYTFVLDDVSPQMFLFTPGNIPDEEVVLFINEKKLQILPESLNRWEREQRVDLPQEFLHKGVNEIVFYYKGDLSHPWGVRNLYIQPHDPHQVHSNHELYDIAQKLYVERFAKPGNLLRSKKLMGKVMQSYRGGAQVPEKYVSFETKIKRELYQLQERYLRDARLLMRNEHRNKAKAYYQKLLRELIDPMDPMRIKIHREMVEMGGL